MDPFSRAPRSRSQVDGLVQSSTLDDSKSSPFVDQVVLLPCFALSTDIFSLFLDVVFLSCLRSDPVIMNMLIVLTYKLLFRSSLLNIVVKKLRKSINICQSYRKNKSVSFFMDHSVHKICVFNSTK